MARRFGKMTQGGGGGGGQNPLSIAEAYRDAKNLVKEIGKDTGLIKQKSAGKRKQSRARGTRSRAAIATSAPSFSPGSSVRRRGREILLENVSNTLALVLDGPTFNALNMSFAQLFSMYRYCRVNRLVLHYVPTCAATVGGAVTMVLFDDPDFVVESLEQLRHIEGSVTVQCWAPMRSSLPPGKTYVNDPLGGTRESAFGILRTITSGGSGNFEIEYDFSFFEQVSSSRVTRWSFVGSVMSNNARLSSHLHGVPIDPVTFGLHDPASTSDPTTTDYCALSFTDENGAALPYPPLTIGSGFLSSPTSGMSLSYMGVPLADGARVYFKTASGLLMEGDASGTNKVLDVDTTTSWLCALSLNPEFTKPVLISTDSQTDYYILSHAMVHA